MLPEAFVSAYPTGLDFGARVGLRQPKGREDFRRYYESGLDVPGPDCDALGRTARDAGVFMVIGVITIALGVGFMMSAVAAYALSRRLGLMEPAQPSTHA